MDAARAHNGHDADTGRAADGARKRALIDERSGAFQTLTLGPYRLVHSGDVKVYEHQAVLPRAFVVGQAETIDDATALARLADPAFDVSATVLRRTRALGMNWTRTPRRARRPSPATRRRA